MTIRKLKALLWFLGLAGFLGAGYTFYDIWEGKRSARYEATDPDYYHGLIRRDLDQVERAGARNAYYSKDRYETLWTVRIDGSWPEPPKTISDADRAAAAQAKVQLAKLEDVLSISSIIWSSTCSLPAVSTIRASMNWRRACSSAPAAMSNGCWSGLLGKNSDPTSAESVFS